MHSVVEPEFLDQAAFAPAGSMAVNIRANNMHFHFAGRISTEPRAVLHQNDFGPLASRGHRGADSSHSTSGYEQVAFQIHQRHIRLARETV